MVIGGTVGPVSSVGRASDLQAGGRGFESCIGNTFSSLAYFNIFLFKRNLNAAKEVTSFVSSDKLLLCSNNCREKRIIKQVRISVNCLAVV